jgi:hypothetical protein
MSRKRAKIKNRLSCDAYPWIQLLIECINDKNVRGMAICFRSALTVRISTVDFEARVSKCPSTRLTILNVQNI